MNYKTKQTILEDVDEGNISHEYILVDVLGRFGFILPLTQNKKIIENGRCRKKLRFLFKSTHLS